ncbi:SRPBCC family protein [Streptomyces sp. NPDC058739]|uniref:SRPBCC family protein n=1 Tax=Streptomyces sp. NPDC058739 TaxID=3346618 RepID=UPI0036C80BC6
MIDVTDQITSVRRRAGRRPFKAAEARYVTIGRVFDVPLDDLWNACTSPERLPQWFLPLTGDLRVGGQYQLEGHAGGTIDRCDPPERLLATWEYEGDISWIELRLSPEGEGRTYFELEHLFDTVDEKWAEYGPGAVGVGWDMALVGLTLHLATGESVDGEQAMAWFGSTEGLSFITASGESWYTANVDSGEDPAVARAAADRNAAAYTGAGQG